MTCLRAPTKCPVNLSPPSLLHTVFSTFADANSNFLAPAPALYWCNPVSIIFRRFYSAGVFISDRSFGEVVNIHADAVGSLKPEILVNYSSARVITKIGKTKKVGGIFESSRVQEVWQKKIYQRGGWLPSSRDLPHCRISIVIYNICVRVWKTEECFSARSISAKVDFPRAASLGVSSSDPVKKAASDEYELQINDNAVWTYVCIINRGYL